MDSMDIGGFHVTSKKDKLNVRFQMDKNGW